MRLYEESKYRGNRVPPTEFWHQAIANWLAGSLGDIYNDKERLIPCYSPKRKNPHDEDDYPGIIYDYIKQFAISEGSTRVFILYGPPAIGKTTYLSYLLKIHLPQKFNCNVYPIFFDLRNVSDFGNLSTKFIEQVEKKLSEESQLQIFKGKNPDEKLKIYIEMFKDKLPNQLTEFDPDNYSIIFENEELKRKVKQTIEDRYLSNPKLTCIRKIEYLTKNNNIDIVFVIDNFDHHPKHEEMHQSVYDLAKEIIVDFKRPIFLPMRNYTFLDSYDRFGYMEADRVRTKSLSVPIHLDVFERRKNYILSKIDKQIKLALEKGIKLDIPPGVFKKKLRVVLEGIAGNNEIMIFLAGVCGDNIRVFLDLILNAIQSGHLEYTERSDGTAVVTYKSFIKACAFCNNFMFMFTEKRTPIINIYDNGEAEGYRNTLIRIRILQYLRHASSPVAVEDIAEELNVLGYRGESILNAFVILRSNGLIEEIPYYRSVKKISMDQQFSISPIGIFYLERLATDPIYFELMSASCNFPLSYKTIVEKLVTLAQETKEHRQNRYEALKKILDYFEKCESQERQIVLADRLNLEKYFILTPQIEIGIDNAYQWR